jgi:hypothetical protein
VTIIVAAMLAAGCGGGSPGRAVAGSAAGQSVSETSVFTRAVAFAQCMRTRGEPNYPDPIREGGSVHETITPGSGVDPNSPQFTGARSACEHLLPNNGVPASSPAQTIAAAERADYLKAAACMRSHGVPAFPDPTFQDNTVTFRSSSPIDTTSPQYVSALTMCRKLIPAGLPYGSSSGH